MKDKSKKERSHSILNRKKVAVAVAKNPTATIREIAKETNIGKSTVDRQLGQLGLVKEKWLEDTLSRDKDIIKLGQEIICEDLIEELEIIKYNKDKENPEDRKLRKLWAWSISWIIKENTARYTLFRWEATDEQGGLMKNKERWDNASVEDLLQFLKTK